MGSEEVAVRFGAVAGRRIMDFLLLLLGYVVGVPVGVIVGYVFARDRFTHRLLPKCNGCKEELWCSQFHIVRCEK